MESRSFLRTSTATIFIRERVNMKKTSFKYTKKFDEEFEYSGKDLGAVCREGQTVFRLWAPFADAVELCLYSEPGDAVELPAESLPEDACRRIPMEPLGRGVWRAGFPENMHGTYYDYLIWRGKESVRTADPYARACSCNGCRSMAVDLLRTDPEGFKSEKAPGKGPENIIYELHIKDFSFDPDSGIPEEFRGKYKAFTVRAPGKDYPTGVEYLKSLGITHVQLLPFFDYGYLDETGDDRQFNWGYDPLNYNVPEGSYATDSKAAEVRIRECKEMIQALHAAGIRVIMDVVYNHTCNEDSWLERTAPGYFYRRYEDGALSNGSACGNDMAAGRAMVDNFIADSCMYWAKEYHMDGFRFDLMGLLTTELINRIQRELDQEFGEGEKLLYGEPWRAAESPMERGTHAALKENVELLDEKIAMFSDDIRDVVKGNVFFPKEPGFVNGGRKMEERILDAVTGWCNNGEGFRPKSCSQVVNYISAHDNFALWDKLLYTMREEGDTGQEEAFLEPFADLLAANKLAALIYFTCQGNLFLQAGEEFGRTKFGDENSYRTAPEINMLRWEQTVRFRELTEYYRGLIALRKKLPGLCDKSRSAARRVSGQRVRREGVVSFFVDNKSDEFPSEFSTLFILYNASDTPETAGLSEEGWYVLADAETADCRRRAEKRLTVAPHSGVICGRGSFGS